MRPAAAAVLVWSLLLWAGAAAAGEFVIGAPTSLETLEGRESANAALLAVEEINRAGGLDLGGRRLKLRLVTTDLKDVVPGEPVQAVLDRLERFVAGEQPHAMVVGLFRSEILLAGMDLIARLRRPLVGTIAMTPVIEAKLLKDRRYRYVFRTGLNARYLADYLIEHLRYLREKFGCRKVYIINQDVAWARTTASMTMRLYFNREGWEVIGQENHPAGTADFSAGLAAAEERGAQVILAVFDDPQSGRLVEQWNQRQMPAMLTGFISPLVGPGAWEAYNGRIAGAQSMVFELGNIPSIRWPEASRFYQAYARRFGREIEAGHGPAPSYEAVYALAEAAVRAGSLDPDDLVRELERTDRRGAMGRLRFHRAHQVVFGDNPEEEALGCLIQWTREGKRRIVYPESLAEGEIQSPGFINSGDK
ncbi:MAG: ABC transporter substrate-binding protein [Proteobacteria bacterium]|nr:ABC transporter substrate-binding protein [Pseudomonadota bacterium]